MAFLAKSTEINALHSLIGSLSGFGTQGILTFHQDRIALSVLDANVCKVELNISSSSLFKTWENTLDPPVVSISIDLGDVIDSLNFHSSIENVEFTLSYSNNGTNQLTFEFNDDLIVETFTLQTYVVDDDDNDHLVGFQLDPTKVISEIVIKSSILYDILKDMKGLHTEKFIVYCLKTQEGYSDKNQLIFISQSKLNSIGLSKLIIPQTRSNIQQFNIFNFINDTEKIPCFNTSLSCNYLYLHFSKLLKALKYSRSVKIRRDLNGLTSVILLLGEQNDHHRKLFDGCSLEFVTLESTGMEIMGIPINNSSNGIGYADDQIDQLIKDDEEISTIRIGTDGQLTLDDYFQSTTNDVVPITVITRDTPFLDKPLEEDIQITPELAQTLLGGINPDDSIVQSSINGTLVGSSDKSKIPNVPTPQIRMKKHGKKSSKRTKRANDGVETVGGAVEIPLFI